MIESKKINLFDIKSYLEEQTGWSFGITKSFDHGILSTNQAFITAKKENISVPEAALLVISRLEEFLVTDSNLVDLVGLFEAKVVGAYVNLYLTTKGVNFLMSTDSLFATKKEQKSILIDYVSPNVAKPIHAGHVRNMNLGESVRRLLSYKFDGVVTDNHWGDWGVQFGSLLYAFKKFRGEPSQDINILLNEEEVVFNFSKYEKEPFETLLYLYIWAGQNKDKIDSFDEIVRQEFVKLEAKDEENYRLWQNFLDVSKGEIGEDLVRFGVKPFDIEWGESHYEPMLSGIYDFFETHKLWQYGVDGSGNDTNARFIDFEKLALFYEKRGGDGDGARAKKVKNLGFAYLVSKDGYSTYLTRDIAARIEWVNKLVSKLMISITGNEQKHHFEQFFAICDFLSTLEITKELCLNYQDLKADNLLHLSYGMLSLRGRAKMSTRSGVIYTAKDFYQDVLDYAIDSLEQRAVAKGEELTESLKKTNQSKAHVISIAAIKWFDLQKDSVHDLSLDISDILSFEGNTGVYQLYTIARINSLVGKNSKASDEIIYNELDYTKLNAQENELIFKLLQLPIVLNQAVLSLKPHLLTTYSFSLANSFNSWYNTCSLLQETDGQRKEVLLNLAHTTKEVLSFNLNLLGIDSLEEM